MPSAWRVACFLRSRLPTAPASLPPVARGSAAWTERDIGSVVVLSL